MGAWADVVLVDDDPERADRGIRQLRGELREFETRDVLTVAPEGSKGDAAAVVVAAALGGAGGMVSLLIAIVRDWLGRRTAGSG